MLPVVNLHPVFRSMNQNNSIAAIKEQGRPMIRVSAP
jgi:hypothetical protein